MKWLILLGLGFVGYLWLRGRAKTAEGAEILPITQGLSPQELALAEATDAVEESVVTTTRECATQITSDEFISRFLLPSGVLTNADVILFARPVTELTPEIYAAQKRRLAEIEQQLGQETSLGEIRNACGQMKKGMYPAPTAPTPAQVWVQATTAEKTAIVQKAALTTIGRRLRPSPYVF